MSNKIYEKINKFIKNNKVFLIVIILLILVFNIKLPYVIYAPGGTIDLSDRIEVEGAYQEQGKFNMAYVTMYEGSLPFVALSYVIPNWDLEKTSNITLENESVSDMLDRDALYYKESINNATISAYNTANKKITISKINNTVIYLTEKSKTDIKIGDNILKINDINVENIDTIKAEIQKHNINDEVTITYERNNNVKTTTAKIYSEDNNKYVGISVITTYEYDTEPELNIKTKTKESGPSGGLMMALEIYNYLVPEDITKGRNIVGTGTINIDGTVGEIGGVKYKLAGAVKAKADIFLCPKENYEEAKSVAKDNDYDIIILSVESIQDAIDKLK